MGRGGGGGGSCDDDHLLVSEDVWIQILLWLPVISLLRFKSVCKSWRCIIESTFFINLHGTTTTNKSGGSSSSSVLINISVQEKTIGTSILKLSGEEFEFFENLSIPSTLLEFGSWLKGYMEFLAVGCCDGIICLHDFFSRNVALWNPAIKQSRILPKPSNPLGFSKCYSKSYLADDDGHVSEDFVRFGIDIKTNDYKLLLITTFKLRDTNYGSDPEGEEDKMFLRSEESPPHRRRVHVYSLSTDSWKCIDDAILSATYPDLAIDIKINFNQGLYLNGSYFFTATCYNEDIYLLLSFDFTEEIFKTIQPHFDVNNKNNKSSYVVYFIRLGGKVALVDSIKEELSYDFEYVIWVLNEQHSGMKEEEEEEESWTKFYTIGPPGRLPNQPIFITNNGEFAITYGAYWQDDQTPQQVLQLLNLITGEKKLLQCDCECMKSHFVDVYKPSLMPIGGNGATPT